jgi:hypothetical protein
MLHSIMSFDTGELFCSIQHRGEGNLSCIDEKSGYCAAENDYERYMNNRKRKPLAGGSKVEHLIPYSTRNTPALSRHLSNREYAKRIQAYLIVSFLIAGSGLYLFRTLHVTRWYEMGLSSHSYPVVKSQAPSGPGEEPVTIPVPH